MKRVTDKKKLKYDDRFLLLHVATNTYLTLDTQLIPFPIKKKKEKNSLRPEYSLNKKKSIFLESVSGVHSANVMFK